MIARVKEWICLILFRSLFPVVLLTACIVRFSAISLIYGFLALISSLVRRPTPVSIRKGTGAFLISCITISTIALIAQGAFQILVKVGGEDVVQNCSPLQRILDQIGLQKIGDSSPLNACRIILPDIATFVTSTFIYLLSLCLLPPNNGNQQLPPQPLNRLSKLGSQLVDFLGGSMVLLLMALCGVARPSILGAVYFVSFLVVATVWACGVGFTRWFVTIEALLLVYNGLHLVFFYANQMPSFQMVWNSSSNNTSPLPERLLGLKRFVYTNCTQPWWVHMYPDVDWADWLNVVCLILFFFVVGVEIRSRYESSRSLSSTTQNIEEDLITTNLNNREHPNYNTIISGDESAYVNRGAGNNNLESSKRFELFKSVAMVMANIVLKQSYIAALISMMAWSITYHSWLTFVFLISACLIWMVPQKRQLTLRLSPLILFYAEALLVINYIYGLELNDTELPVKTPGGYPLSEIGLVKSLHPFISLSLQCLFTFFFFLTLRHYIWESHHNQAILSPHRDATSLDAIEVPYNTLSENNLIRRNSIVQTNEVLQKIGNFLIGFLTKYWILVCALLFLLMAVQDSVVYRIVYMVLFLFFIISFQLSYRFWRAMVKVFWVVVVGYSIFILGSIYVIQFENVMETIHNSTGISYQVLRDLGFQKYSTKDLFVSLLTPTSFLIVVILLIHYFQTNFLAISDLNRYRNADEETVEDTESVYGQNQKASWKEALLIGYSLFTRGVVLLWRCAQVHVNKMVVVAVFVVCAVDVCLLNVILVTFVIVLMPLRFNRSLSILSMIHSCVVIVTRMVYQLHVIGQDSMSFNCSELWNTTETPSREASVAKYIGYRKNPDVFIEVKNHIFLVLLLAFESIVHAHQKQYFNHPHHPAFPSFLIFPNISRKNADQNLKHALMFLVNCGFYKFGKEICFGFTAIVIAIRLDLLSLLYGLLLGLLIFPLRRSMLRKIWPCYVALLTVVLFVQYLACLGLPPVLCYEYPWDIKPLSYRFPYNLKVFLFLPEYTNPPRSVKLILDFIQLLLASLQVRAFFSETKQQRPINQNNSTLGQLNTENPDNLQNSSENSLENSPENSPPSSPKTTPQNAPINATISQYGGHNDSILPDLKIGSINPTDDFVLFRNSYLDYIKVGVFYYSFWITLLLLFITASTRISLFSLGYLTGCFYFLWYGQDLLLKPIGQLNRIWSLMLFYCYSVLIFKTALQLVGCVYYMKVPCLVIRLFHISCIGSPGYQFPAGIIKSGDEASTKDVTIVCNVIGEHGYLIWDVISFISIVILLRAYKSWYFQNVVRELLADNELASRGSELINEMTYQRAENQRRFEATVLDKIRLKVERIRMKMLSQSAKLSNLHDQVKPFNDHYQVIRSGDYYMFEDLITKRDEEVAMGGAYNKSIKELISLYKRRERPPTIGELLNAWSVSNIRSALFLWNTWAAIHKIDGRESYDNDSDNNNKKRNKNRKSKGQGGDGDDDNNDDNEDNNNTKKNDDEGEYEEDADGGDDGGDDSDYQIIEDDEGEEEDEDGQKKKKRFKTTRGILNFIYVLLLAGCEQLIIFLDSLAIDYILISKKLKEEKQKRRHQSLLKKSRDMVINIDEALQTSQSSTYPHPTSPSPSLPSQAPTPHDPYKAETHFHSHLPLPLRICGAFFIVFLNNSELLCYFAMTIVALQYGSIFSIVYPITALLWGMLSCPRPSKTFWLFAIGYTEAIIIIKYIFQFFDFVGPTEPSASSVFYPPYVIGVSKDKGYALFYILLLFCLFFHRSVLRQHGLWKNAENTRKDLQLASTINNNQDGNRNEPTVPNDITIQPSTSSRTPSLRKRIFGGKKSDGKQGSNSNNEDGDDGDDYADNGYSDDDDADFKMNYMDDGDVNDERKKKHARIKDCGSVDEDEDEFSKFCCGFNISRPFTNIYRLLKESYFRAATDVYVFIFLTDIISLLITIIGFSSFGPSDYSTSGVMVTTVLKKNKIPPAFLGMLLAQFILIMIDRAIYLRKQVLLKFLFQVVLVLGIHAWIFFGLPIITQRRFTDNIAAQLWYFTKCVYLALSSYQIKSGYPTCILGNFLTKKYNYLNLFCFKGFLIIPFLLELRALMDWMFTDTTLVLTSWLQMEDIYANIFCIKCNRSAEKRYKTPRGLRKAAYIKYGLGGTFLFILILVIWFPLLLFSMSNTIFEANKPMEVSVNIKLAGFEQLFSATSQQIVPFSSEDYNFFYSTYPITTRTFLSSYQLSDIYNCTLMGESGAVWTISPPALREMIAALKDREVITMQFSISIRRNPTGAAEVILGQFDRLLYKGVVEDELVRKKLSTLISRESDKAVDVYSMFPRYVIVPATGKISSAENYFIPYLSQQNSTASDMNGNIELSLYSADYDNNTRWWSVDQIYVGLGNRSKNSSGRRGRSGVVDRLSDSKSKMLRVVTFNERIAPSGVLSVLNNYGIIGLYASLVLVVGRFVRMYIQGLSYKIMFQELPDPDVLLILCQDIYMVRESAEFRLEEELFAQLMFLYRSPETLVKVTKQKIE